MSISPALCGVILAAGESSRMGRDKALLLWPPGADTGQTFLSAAIESLIPFTEMVMVVVGKNESALAPIVFAHGAFLVKNPKPERGQFSSLQVGLQEVLNRGRDAAIVTLVDRPPANPATLQILHDEFSNAPSGTWALIPEHSGHHGHPIVLGIEMIEAFLKAPATANARELEHEYREHIAYFPVNDPAVARNVNTPEEYAALCSPLESHS